MLTCILCFYNFWVWLKFADWLPRYVNTREQRQTAGKYVASCFAGFVNLKLNDRGASMSCSTMFESSSWEFLPKNYRKKTGTYNYGIVCKGTKNISTNTVVFISTMILSQLSIAGSGYLRNQTKWNLMVRIVATCIEYLHNQPPTVATD